MKVTIPQDINDTTLISSNVPTGDYPDWVSGGGSGTSGAYVRGARVVEGIEIYECLATETTDQPSIGINLEPATWLRLGYINKWRMFTETKDSLTTLSSGDIDVKFTSAEDFYDQLALLGLLGSSVTVEVLDAVDSIVWTETTDLVDIGVEDWFEYFNAPYDQIESVVYNDILYQPSGKIRVLMDGNGGDTSVGRVVLGSSNFIGTTDYGTSVGLLTFSQFTRDGFGNLTVRQGRTVNVVDFEVTVQTDYVDTALRVLRDAGGKIAFYVGVEDKEATYILGIADEPRINYDYYSISSLSLEVQGQ